jgi:hypothetical protein
MQGSKHYNFERIGKKRRPEHGGKSFSRGCDGKHRFDNEHDAGKRAKRITEQGGPQMRSYLCLHCGGHHLTSRP